MKTSKALACYDKVIDLFIILSSAVVLLNSLRRLRSTAFLFLKCENIIWLLKIDLFDGQRSFYISEKRVICYLFLYKVNKSVFFALFFLMNVLE